MQRHDVRSASELILIKISFFGGEGAATKAAKTPMAQGLWLEKFQRQDYNKKLDSNWSDFIQGWGGS